MLRLLFILWALLLTSVPALTASAQESVISRIEILGNKEVPTEKILETVNNKPGDPLIRERLRRDLQAIFDMGFFTDVKIDFLEEEGGTRVIFFVVENPLVQMIEMTGPRIVPEDKLRTLMHTKVGSILNSKLLYGDVIAINDHYESLGYTEPANHVTDLSWTPEGILRLAIAEGTPVTKIEITGNTVFSSESLLHLVKTAPGELFNRKKIEEDIGRIATRYTQDDYLIQGLKGMISSEGVVTLSVQEAQVETIVIQGNKKTKEKVVRAQIRTKVGEVLRNNRVKRDVQRLQNTGYFEKVDVAPEDGSRPGQVKLVFTVKEQKTGFATAGVGFSGGGASQGGGISGTLSFTERNIGGTGRSASVGWQKGTLVSVLNFTFVYPFLDDAETSIGLNYFNSTLDEQRQALPNTNPTRFALFTDRRIGERVTLGRTIVEDLRMFLTLKTEKIRATSTPTPEFPDLITSPTDGSLNSVGLVTVYDTRDDIFNAHKGVYYSAAVEQAGTILSGDFNFMKYTGEVRQYYPHGKNTIALRLLAGGSGGILPLAEKYVLGGSETLRGYTLNRFIGDKFLLFSTEYRFPILGSKMFSGAVFFDAGNTFQAGERFRISGLKSDYGIGARVNVPGLGLGTIRIDFAIGQEGKRSVIGIGQSF